MKKKEKLIKRMRLEGEIRIVRVILNFEKIDDVYSGRAKSFEENEEHRKYTGVFLCF